MAGVSVGPNGVLRISQLYSVNATINNKTLSILFNGATQSSITLNTAAQFGFSLIYTLQNRGIQNAQVWSSSSQGVGPSPGINAFTTINTAAAVTYAVSLNNAVATDFSILESFLLEAIPG